jgi:hypothetical protein
LRWSPLAHEKISYLRPGSAVERASPTWAETAFCDAPSKLHCHSDIDLSQPGMPTNSAHVQAPPTSDKDRAARHTADVNRLLLNAMRSAPVAVVATVRADFYDPLIGHQQEIKSLLPTRQVPLGSMPRSDLEHTVVEPSRRVRAGDSGWRQWRHSPCRARWRAAFSAWSSASWPRRTSPPRRFSSIQTYRRREVLSASEWRYARAGSSKLQRMRYAPGSLPRPEFSRVQSPVTVAEVGRIAETPPAPRGRGGV